LCTVEMVQLLLRAVATHVTDPAMHGEATPVGWIRRMEITFLGFDCANEVSYFLHWHYCFSMDTPHRLRFHRVHIRARGCDFCGHGTAGPLELRPHFGVRRRQSHHARAEAVSRRTRLAPAAVLPRGKRLYIYLSIGLSACLICLSVNQWRPI
jgi:hypothetical protein